MPNPSPSPTPTPFLPFDTNPTKTVAQEILDLPGIRDLPYKHLLLIGLDLALLLLFYLGVRRLVQHLIVNTAEAIARREEATGDSGRAARLRTLASLINGIAVWTLGFIFIVAGLSTLNISVAGIVGTASVAGLAFGFGAQKLAKDMITGFFILLEDQYAVGDYVTISGVTGTVEELGMRITRIRDDEGKIYILSNGDIATVCNQSRGTLSGSVEISIAAKEDPANAIAVLNEHLAPLAETFGFPEPPHVDGITVADGAKTTLKVLFKTASHQRPGAFTARVREAAREVLVAANISLGGP